MTDHTVKSFGEQLEALSALVAQMGGLAEAQFAAAIEAIARRDSTAAESAVGGDARIDEIQQEIEDRALKLLALRQPMAVDLRETLAAIKTAAELERIGDLAKNIAKRALVLNREPPIRLTQSLARMGKAAQNQLKQVLDAFSSRNAEAAEAVWNARWRDRRNLQQPVPRTSHLHDGRPAHHRAVHPSSVRRQEYRAQRRPLPPTSPRSSITWCAPTISPTTGPRPTPPAKPPFPTRPARMSKPTILVAEDEGALVTLLRYNLEREGYRVLEARDGEEALLVAAEEQPDLVMLDWMLPQLSGIEVCRRLRGRQETRNVPIIMLTARGEETDRIRGLDTGADDYLTKPFSMTELLARLRAVLRRIRPSLAEDVVQVGDIEMDRAAHRVRRAGMEVHLGPTEYRLLDHLIQHPGRVFSREQLLDAVWGSDVYVEARTVDVHVGRLRKALNIEGAADPIRTVRSAGYSLDESAHSAA